MKPLINLASEPFRNRRLLWLLVGLIFSAATLVGLNILNEKSKLEQQIALLDPKVEMLRKKAGQAAVPDFTGSTLSISQNQALLVAQELIDRKGFSWSQLLNDLERYIPTTVRVTRIGVDKVGGKKKAADGQAIFLTFDAVGKSSSAMTQMISDLNRSAKFSVNPKAVRPVEGTDEVEFDLEVEYRPASFSNSESANLQIAAEVAK